MPNIPRSTPRAQRWRQHLADWQRSGLTVRDFCQRHGLALPTFSLWRRRFQAESRTTPAFVPVRLRADSRATAPSTTAAPCLELRLPQGRGVQVPVGFDAATLRQLLAVLEEPPC